MGDEGGVWGEGFRLQDQRVTAPGLQNNSRSLLPTLSLVGLWSPQPARRSLRARTRKSLEKTLEPRGPQCLRKSRRGSESLEKSWSPLKQNNGVKNIWVQKCEIGEECRQFLGANFLGGPETLEKQGRKIRGKKFAGGIRWELHWQFSLNSPDNKKSTHTRSTEPKSRRVRERVFQDFSDLVRDFSDFWGLQGPRTSWRLSETLFCSGPETFSSLGVAFKSWFLGRGWGQQLFSFQSPAVHWIAQTSSLNCLSCRNPYQTPHSLNCLPPFSLKSPFFTEKCFVASPSQKSAQSFAPPSVREIFKSILVTLSQCSKLSGSPKKNMPKENTKTCLGCSNDPWP